ncbi:unnamed protein product [Cyclocybe aegerita]|uniref:lytic cellulose monooxygenase (C4-dehydrogenating) n=1 Tax=Cyclocybe aegerita TaxID=1973307 RepID=A0A8S0X0S4_CYCAE|nr:unnamed protein product [Cyclocybe aegerita]
MKTISFLLPLLAATYVSAHGFLNQITINGKTYRGNKPNQRNDPSVIRRVSSPNPNYGANNAALTCGPNSIAGSLVADANPGDTVTFDWRGVNLSPWPHSTGPMLTYMASCGSTTCDKFNPTNARWFKIGQAGKKSNGQWFQQDLMSGQTASATIPKTLAPGNYLIRHEIIALHLASSGQAEYYPACAQLRVGGNQTSRPKDSELVSFPGGYKDSDAGIRLNPYTNAKYVFPGPAVASLVSGGAATPSTGNGNGNANTSSSAPASSTRASSSTKVSTTTASSTATVRSTTKTTSANASQPTKASSGGCRARRAKVRRGPVDADTLADDEEIIVRRPRHVSRIMRRAAFEQSLH